MKTLATVSVRLLDYVNTLSIGIQIYVDAHVGNRSANKIIIGMKILVVVYVMKVRFVKQD
jgi:hypothetical protein